MVDRKQVNIWLKPEEMEELKQIAKKERRSLTNMGTVLLVKGIKDYKEAEE